LETDQWGRGSLELIEHGLNHLKQGNDFDLRIALISIDNALEIGIKTYLTKNRRALGIERKKLKDSKKYFPQILDLFEATHQLGVMKEDLDAIEFYHSIRNNLYHEGIGITVEKRIVEAYYAIVNNLLLELFNIKKEMEDKESLDLQDTNKEYLINQFSRKINSVEALLREFLIVKLKFDGEKPFFGEMLKIAGEKKIFTENELNVLDDIRKRRNNLYHNAIVPSEAILISDINFLINTMLVLKRKYDEI